MRRFVCLLSLALGMALLSIPASANSIVEPTYGEAVVDGAYGEWDLTDDFFCVMYRDGDAGQPLTARIYLRYDCETGTMYVLVLTEPGIPAMIRPFDAWIKVVGRNGKVFDGDPYNDGPPSDFAWVDPNFGGDFPHAWGYEGKFPLFEGAYQLIFHLLVLDEYQIRTSATAGFPDQGCWVMINCGSVPTEPTSWGRIKQTYR